MKIDTKTEVSVSMTGADFKTIAAVALVAISDEGPAGKIAARKATAEKLNITAVQAQKIINALAEDPDSWSDVVDAKEPIDLAA